MKGLAASWRRGQLLHVKAQQSRWTTVLAWTKAGPKHARGLWEARG